MQVVVHYLISRSNVKHRSYLIVSRTDRRVEWSIDCKIIWSPQG